MSIYTYNYEQLMANNPTIYDTLTNSLNQQIDLAEHPTRGDESFVICICHELKLAEDSSFFETDDMVAEHHEYEPRFENGKLFIGSSQAH